MLRPSLAFVLSYVNDSYVNYLKETPFVFTSSDPLANKMALNFFLFKLPIANVIVTKIAINY